MGGLTQISDALGDAIGAVEEAVNPKPEEDAERARCIAYLFKLFSEADAQLAEMYLEQTREIPLWALRLGLTALVRKYRWPKLPRIADIWLSAREVAGMHRQQYSAGRYVSEPSEWPPENQRHGINVGTLEPLTTLHALSLPRTEERLRLERGGISDEEAGVFD